MLATSWLLNRQVRTIPLTVHNIHPPEAQVPSSDALVEGTYTYIAYYMYLYIKIAIGVLEP